MAIPVNVESIALCLLTVQMAVWGTGIDHRSSHPMFEVGGRILDTVYSILCISLDLLPQDSFATLLSFSVVCDG